MTGFKLRPLHYAISVQDLDASLAWYEEMFGFTEISRTYVDPAKAVCVTAGSDVFQIEIFRQDETIPMEDWRKDPDANVQHQGSQHICFEVDDLEGFIAELRAKGATILFGPVFMGDISLYYIADNNGIPIELMQAPK